MSPRAFSTPTKRSVIVAEAAVTHEDASEISPALPKESMNTSTDTSMAQLQRDLDRLLNSSDADESSMHSHPPSLHKASSAGDAFARMSVRPSTANSEASSAPDTTLSALHRAARAGNKERVLRVLASGEVWQSGWEGRVL